MKWSPLSLRHSLRIVVVLVALAFAAESAQAENPFKFLGAKARQGLSKVKQVVHPRRIGAALKNLKPAPLKPAPRVPVRPVNPSDYPDAARPSSGSSPFTIPAASGRNDSTAIPSTGSADDATRRNQAGARPTSPETHEGVPGQRQMPESAGPVSPALPSVRPPPLVDPPQLSTPETVRPAPAREDLPYGGLVPGKTGFVYSPWSKKGLVDVSGIPTGTKVKCPYTGKTFRVP